MKGKVDISIIVSSITPAYFSGYLAHEFYVVQVFFFIRFPYSVINVSPQIIMNSVHQATFLCLQAHRTRAELSPVACERLLVPKRHCVGSDKHKNPERKTYSACAYTKIEEAMENERIILFLSPLSRTPSLAPINV